MLPDPVTVVSLQGATTYAGSAGQARWMPPLAPPYPYGTARLLTLANLDGAHVCVRLPPGAGQHVELVHSSDPDRGAGPLDPDRFILLPGEVVLLMLGDGAR